MPRKSKRHSKSSFSVKTFDDANYEFVPTLLSGPSFSRNPSLSPTLVGGFTPLKSQKQKLLNVPTPSKILLQKSKTPSKIPKKLLAGASPFKSSARKSISKFSHIRKKKDSPPAFNVSPPAPNIGKMEEESKGKIHEDWDLIHQDDEGWDIPATPFGKDTTTYKSPAAQTMDSDDESYTTPYATPKKSAPKVRDRIYIDLEEELGAKESALKKKPRNPSYVEVVKDISYSAKKKHPKTPRFKVKGRRRSTK